MSVHDQYGYEIKEMRMNYTDLSGEEVSVVPEQFKFDMPASDITLSVSTKLVENAVEYRDENGLYYSCPDYTDLSEAEDGAVLTDGWYVAKKDLVFNKRLTVNGDVNIILCDGVMVTCKNGIHNREGNTLTVWGTKIGTGELETVGGKIDFEKDEEGAGIGGDKNENDGTLNMHTGRLNILSGKRGAAIGRGENGTGGTVNIYGGTVYAKSSCGGAGIGGGHHADGGVTSIYGGFVCSEAGYNCERLFQNGVGAGIGGGDGGNGGTITISGGSVYAYGNLGFASRWLDEGCGAAIGGGDEGVAGTIRITGGNIEANAYDMWGDYRECEAAGIGSGKKGKGGKITITGGSIHAGGYVAVGAGKKGKDVTICLGGFMEVDGYSFEDGFKGLAQHQAYIYTTKK